MRHIAAYILATLGGNSQPSSSDVSSILKSVGIASDAQLIEKVVSELSGKNVDAVVSEGMKKFASIPSGVAVVSAPAASSNAPAAAAAKEAPKKKEESEEEMGLGLFD